MNKLNDAWQAQHKLRDEGNKLRAEGVKLKTEGTKLRAEGDKLNKSTKLSAESFKLSAEGNKLWAEGNKRKAEGTELVAMADVLWSEAIIATYGNITLEWRWNEVTHDSDCILGNGEHYVAPVKETV